MKKKFILLYDCPIDKCDKIWLFDGLKKIADVKIIKTGIRISYFKLSRMFPKLKIGKIFLRFFVLVQSLKAIIYSDEEDIIVTWSNFQGVLLSTLCMRFRINRKIVSFNWIDLPDESKYKKIKKILENKKVMPIINAKYLEKEFIKKFKLKKWNGFFLPDVFDDKEEFKMAEYEKKEKYCFAGGVNNRDWETLIDALKELPEMKCIIVAGKNDINSNQLPNNVMHLEEISAKEYYNLMKGAFLTICPLKENKVSGLINIIKSIQYGIPCIATNSDVTSIYYPERLKQSELLYKKNDKESLEKSLKYCWNLSKDEYIQLSKEMQKHLKNNFNPYIIIETLKKELIKRKWI